MKHFSTHIDVYISVIVGILVGWFIVYFTARLVWIFIIKGIWRAGLKEIMKIIGITVLNGLGIAVKTIFLIGSLLFCVAWQLVIAVKQWIDDLNKKLDDIDKRMDAKAKDRDKTDR